VNGELTATIPNPDLLWDGRHTRALDGESFWGHQLNAFIGWQTAKWNVSFDYLESSASYHDYIALIRQNHYRNIQTVMGHFIRSESGLFETVNPHIRADAEWNWDGKLKHTTYELCLWSRLRVAQAGFYSQYVGSSENFGGKQYDRIWYVYQDAAFSLGDPVQLRAEVTYGHRIARRYNTLGKILDFQASLDIKPHDRVLVQQWLNHARAIAVEGGAKLYDGYIWRIRINYQASKHLTARLVTEYNDFYEEWRVDPLVTFRLNPFSVLYVGMTSNYQRLDTSSPGETSSYSNRLASRQFFMKIQYLFRI
jgi:hypothetical protein